MKLESIGTNLIDLVWHDKPERKLNPIIALDTSITGRTIADKVAQIRRDMVVNKCTTVVITALDDVACKFFLNEKQAHSFIILYRKSIESHYLLYDRVVQFAWLRHRIQSGVL